MLASARFRFLLVILALILGMSALFLFVLRDAQAPHILPSEREALTDPEPEKPDTARLIFVGDIMLDRGVKSSVYRNFDNDYARLFDHLDILTEGDLVFGNLEGPISDVGRNVGSRFSFRMDPIVLPALVDAGFTIFSFANNHVGDWSQVAFEDTLTRLSESGIDYTGAGWNKDEARTPTVTVINDISIGMLGFTDVGPNWMEAGAERAGILLASDPLYEDIIKDAADMVDILIVTLHWGDEYVPFNARQERLAKSAIDAGADMIIGHHPHVIQGIEYYNGKLIAYSLGNFIFDQYFSKETMQGLILDMIVDKHGIIEMTPLVSEQARTYQPITVRPLKDEDIVQQRVSVPSLCPPAQTGGPDRWLFPVDRVRSLDTYIPPALTHMPNRVETRGTATCLTPQTADAFERMFIAMIDDGLQPVMTSGYRSYAIQDILYRDWLGKQGDVLPEFPSVAQPGHSEHQLGTTVDIKSLQTNDFSYGAFIESPEYAWLQEHAADYGFVQSYTAGNEHRHGYIAEPWHWRYIGSERAHAFLTSNLTLNEWLARYE